MSEAEKAWEAFAKKSIDDFIPAPIAGGMKYSFMAGRASRDQEIAELREARRKERRALVHRINDYRAELRRCILRGEALHAVIEKVRGVLTDPPLRPASDRVIKAVHELRAVPSGVLAERDANKWDEGAAANWDGQDLRHPNPYRGGTR